ncbi:MAG TPA: PfkB family carbohydrate kinase [Saprospiraceae bacterium]|nr:PfkB family carbohydrate kinase [Saprospiraceae bacterium]HPN68275.1 PfkB family carbohydrate kinase [Saprospiraceae bacterium]
MTKSKILIFGDVMLDKYVIGDAHRISPEAPVPVVNITNTYHTLGGASNVAHNLVNVGVENDLIGGIAPDENGRLLQFLLNEKNIGDKLKEVLDVTITKTRVISRNQQMIRIDMEGKPLNNGLYNTIEEELFDHYGFIIISDYGKGTCTERIIQRILHKAETAQIKVLIDPKGSNWEKYRGAYLVKPNIAELEEAIGRKVSNEDNEVIEVCQALLNQYDLQNIVATRGEKGMVLVNKNMVHFFRAKKVEVYDVSGAGDTAIAILGYGLSEGYSLENSIIMANLASSYVVTRPQTYAITKEELKNLTSKILKD